MPWKNFLTQPFKNAQYKHMLPPPEPEAAPSQAAPADANPGAPTQDDLAQEAQAEPSQAAPAEAGPGAPPQAAPPQGCAYYCMSALALMDPQNRISNFFTRVDSGEAELLRIFAKHASLPQLKIVLTETHHRLQCALDSQKRTVAQLKDAIRSMSSEQERIASMQAQLEFFSMQLESVLAQKQKEKEAEQLAEMTRLAEEQLMLHKQAKAAEIVEMMKENGFSIDDLNQALKPEH